MLQRPFEIPQPGGASSSAFLGNIFLIWQRCSDSLAGSVGVAGWWRWLIRNCFRCLSKIPSHLNFNNLSNQYEIYFILSTICTRTPFISGVQTPKFVCESANE
jgi:hypothetical protein